jgi:hypothetical protein
MAVASHARPFKPFDGGYEPNSAPTKRRIGEKIGGQGEAVRS